MKLNGSNINLLQNDSILLLFVFILSKAKGYHRSYMRETIPRIFFVCLQRGTPPYEAHRS